MFLGSFSDQDAGRRSPGQEHLVSGISFPVAIRDTTRSTPRFFSAAKT